MHIFRYDGKSSRDFGLVISGQDTWIKPVPRITRTSVPGRSGDYISFDGSYENVNIMYTCGIQRQFGPMYTALINHLLARPGYRRLEDSYHPDIYRLGIVLDLADPQLRTLNRAGEFELTFNCKPQSFLKSGEQTRTYTSSGTIYNPTLFSSKPLLRVYGSGTFGIGSSSVTITNADVYTDLDCEAEDAYKDDASHNCSEYVQLSGDHFPVIEPGEHGITLGSGITKIEIVPRWWML